MVDIKKLKSRMALKGYKQGSLVTEMNKRGFKISENTFSSKMNGKSKFNCEDADIICEILEIEGFSERAEIFLA